MNKNICFIGGGKMAEALVRGLLIAGTARPKNIISTDIDPSRLKYLSKTYRINVEKNNIVAVNKANIIILAVKPQNIGKVIAGIKKNIKRKQLVITIAAGITLGSLEKTLPGIPIVRVMPNNPALIAAGITAISIGKHITKEHRSLVEKVFRSVGKIIYIKEKHLDAVTAVSGSGPAFLYYFVSAMIEAGTYLGLSKKNASEFAIETVLGASKTLLATGRSPQQLIDMVASKGGTTIAGLKELNKKKFGKILRSAIISASERSKQLSRQYKV